MWTWLPNALTLARIAAAPLVIWGIADGHMAGWGALAFVLAAATDWLDGFAARALNATSALGAKLDLWADKIIVAAPLFGFAMFSHFQLFALAALLALTVRDLYIMRLRAAHPNAALAASFLAKSKTAIVMIGLAIVLIGHWRGANDQLANLPSIYLLGWTIILIGSVLSLYTGWQYIDAVRRHIAARNA